jgi:phosphoserine phosphatase
LKPDATIVGAERKRELLVELARIQSIPINEILCVGDGANDLPMLNAVGDGKGVAVACRAKPKVQADAPNRLNTGNLADLLYLFDLQARTSY